MHLDDFHYVQSYQEGNFDAFGVLYERYFEKIYHYIYRKCSDQAQAEDITSQVFMKSLQKLQNFHEVEGASFSSWLYRIAHNALVDFYRTKHETISEDEVLEMSFSEDFATHIDAKDAVCHVQEFLKELKPIEQEIITLRIWDELSYKEISQITGKKEDNCKQIYKRSLEKILANVTYMIFLFLFL